MQFVVRLRFKVHARRDLFRSCKCIHIKSHCVSPFEHGLAPCQPRPFARRSVGPGCNALLGGPQASGASAGEPTKQVAAARSALCQAGRVKAGKRVQRRVEKKREKGLSNKRAKSGGRSRCCGWRARFCQEKCPKGMPAEGADERHRMAARERIIHAKRRDAMPCFRAKNPRRVRTWRGRAKLCFVLLP
jgi:hypothetical protein